MAQSLSKWCAGGSSGFRPTRPLGLGAPPAAKLQAKPYTRTALLCGEAAKLSHDGVTAKIVYSVSTGSFDGRSRRKYDAGYFEWIFTNLRGFCEKSKASSRLFARPSV